MSQQRRHLAVHSSCSIHEKTLLCSSSIIKTGTNFWIFIFSKQHHFFLSYYLFHKWWAVPWAHKTESCYTTRNECNVGFVIYTDTSVGHLLSLYHLTTFKLPDTWEERAGEKCILRTCDVTMTIRTRNRIARACSTNGRGVLRENLDERVYFENQNVFGRMLFSANKWVGMVWSGP